MITCSDWPWRHDAHQLPSVALLGKDQRIHILQNVSSDLLHGLRRRQIWFAYATTELQIVLARMFAGLFTGGIFVSFLTYIVNTAAPEDQGKYLTINATIKSVASAFGYMIGGFLGEFSVKLAFLAQAALLIAVAVGFYLICLPDGKTSLKQVPKKQLMKEANPFQAFADSRNS